MTTQFAQDADDFPEVGSPGWRELEEAPETSDIETFFLNNKYAILIPLILVLGLCTYLSSRCRARNRGRSGNRRHIQHGTDDAGGGAGGCDTGGGGFFGGGCDSGGGGGCGGGE